MHNDPQNATTISADRYPTVLPLTVLFIIDGKLIRVTKDRRCSPKRYFVFTDVRFLFYRIPIEFATQSSSSPTCNDRWIDDIVP
jgi:hypothetical protein